MRIPVADGVALSVRHWPGSRPCFLLVHGLASNARMWDGVAEILSGAGHRVAAVDQRGHGQSDKPDDGYDFDTLSADLLAVLDALEVDKAVAAGQSWGAHVVIELAARHPDRVGAVVCVDGGMHDMADRIPEWADAERLLAPPEFTGTTLEQVTAYGRRVHADWPESGIQGMLANFEVLPDGTVKPWLTRARHMTIVRQLWEHRSSEVRAQLTMPLIDIPAREYDAHHDIHAQKPDVVAALLLGALEE